MRLSIKFVFLAIFAFLLTSILATPIFAQTINTPKEDGSENTTLASDEVVNEDYFSVGEKVTLDGTVNGDAYLAGGNVYVNGTIDGDLLTAGGNVTIRGTVTGNVRTAGGNILITGSVGEDVTALGGSVTLADNATVTGSLTTAAGNLQVYSPVGKGMTLGVGQATLSNTVGGNITAGVGTLDLLSGANITGDITYWSEEEANISQDATIAGELNHNIPPAKKTEVDPQQTGKFIATTAIYYKLFSTAAAFIVGLILIRLAPTFVERVSNKAITQLGKSILLGLAVLFVTPVIIVLLLITLIGIPLALLTTAIYAISLYFAKIFVARAIGKKIFQYTNRPKTSAVWALLLGLVVLGIIDFIPLIGWLVSFVALLTGLGALIIYKKEFYKVLRDKKLI